MDFSDRLRWTGAPWTRTLCGSRPRDPPMHAQTVPTSHPQRHADGDAAPRPAPLPSLQSKWPGLLLVGAITALAYGLRQLPGVGLLSPMILAIALGIVFHNTVSTPLRAKAGVQFSMRRLLRTAIVLLGLQLTFSQVAEVGGRGMAIIAATLLSTFLFTRWLGARLCVERRLAELIAAGTSICGASAVIATNTVTRGSDEDVAYAVACVT